MHKLLHRACEVGKSGPPERKAFIGACARRYDGTLVWSANILADERKPHAHAEARVSGKCDVGAIVYVARTRRDNGEIAMARPCPTCQSIMKNRGIHKVYYTVGPDEWGCIELNKKRK